MWKSQKTPPKLLELIQQLSNMAGYKINAQKSPAFLNTNSVTEEREIEESIPFTTAPKTIKIPRNKPNKRGKGSLCYKLQNTY